MKMFSLHAENQPAQDNEPDPREQAMDEVGLSESEKEKFRRARHREMDGKPSRDRDDALDSLRRRMAARMLKSAPNQAIAVLKELIHNPPRLHPVAGRGSLKVDKSHG